MAAVKKNVTVNIALPVQFTSRGETIDKLIIELIKDQIANDLMTGLDAYRGTIDLCDGDDLLFDKIFESLPEKEQDAIRESEFTRMPKLLKSVYNVVLRIKCPTVKVKQ